MKCAIFEERGVVAHDEKRRFAMVSNKRKMTEPAKRKAQQFSRGILPLLLALLALSFIGAGKLLCSSAFGNCFHATGGLGFHPDRLSWDAVYRLNEQKYVSQREPDGL